MANGNKWWIGAAVTVGLALIAGSMAYGVSKGESSAKIDSLSKEVVKNSASRDTTIGLSKDVEYIKEDIKEIKEVQKTQDAKLDKILEKLG